MRFVPPLFADRSDVGEHQHQFHFALVVPVAQGNDGQAQRFAFAFHQKTGMARGLGAGFGDFFEDLRVGQYLFHGGAADFIRTHAEQVAESAVRRSDDVA